MKRTDQRRQFWGKCGPEDLGRKLIGFNEMGKLHHATYCKRSTLDASSSQSLVSAENATYHGEMDGKCSFPKQQLANPQRLLSIETYLSCDKATGYASFGD